MFARHRWAPIATLTTRRPNAWPSTLRPVVCAVPGMRPIVFAIRKPAPATICARLRIRAPAKLCLMSMAQPPVPATTSVFWDAAFAGCESLSGCSWNGTACVGGALCSGASSTCHAELKRSLRPGATKSIIVLSDEDDCDDKDWKYSMGATAGSNTAYDGDCSGGTRESGVFPMTTATARFTTLPTRSPTRLWARVRWRAPTVPRSTAVSGMAALVSATAASTRTPVTAARSAVVPGMQGRRLAPARPRSARSAAACVRRG